MESSCDLIVGLKTWAATQNLRKPELTNGAFHMLDLAMSRCWCFDPLGWLSAYTTDHVCMSEGLGCRSVVGLGDSCGERLSDTRVQGGGSAGYDVGIDRWLSCR